MSSASPARNREILDAFEDILGWFREQGLYETYKNQLTRLAVDHILLAATVRVARQDPGHPLIKEFADYMELRFPGWETHPCLRELPILHRLLVSLIRGRHYKTVRLLFRLKG